METETRIAGARPAPLVVGDLPDSQNADNDWESIGKSVEAALEQVTFTTSEIENVLALDDLSWRLIGGWGRWMI